MYGHLSLCLNRSLLTLTDRDTDATCLINPTVSTHSFNRSHGQGPSVQRLQPPKQTQQTGLSKANQRNPFLWSVNEHSRAKRSRAKPSLCWERCAKSWGRAERVPRRSQAKLAKAKQSLPAETALRKFTWPVRRAKPKPKVTSERRQARQNKTKQSKAKQSKTEPKVTSECYASV